MFTRSLLKRDSGAKFKLFFIISPPLNLLQNAQSDKYDGERKKTTWEMLLPIYGMRKMS